MKKIFTILCLMAVTMMAQAQTDVHHQQIYGYVHLWEFGQHMV